MSTDLRRHVLNGPTMGSRWSAVLFAPPAFDGARLRTALQAAVDEVDAQMSTWRPDSDLMRLNRAPVGEWVAVPSGLVTVLRLGLQISLASGGAFDLATGDAVTAWGFGPQAASAEAIRTAMTVIRSPTHEVLDLEPERLRKRAPLTLDLNGIAKGFGVDRLAETVLAAGLSHALVSIDGEVRALGQRPDGEGWAIAIEAPDPNRRAPHSVLVLQDAAIATSGDYRHWVEVGTRRLSHTMDPARGMPLPDPPASVSVVARTCAEADAWATALMVLGPAAGAELARERHLDAVFLHRVGGRLLETRVGGLFGLR